MSRGTRLLTAILSVLLAAATVAASPARGAFDAAHLPTTGDTDWSGAAAPGMQCSYSLSSTSTSVPSTGRTGRSVSVVTGTSCSWTATSNDAWITVTGGANSTGSGNVTYSVQANTTTSGRSGTLTIAGLTYAVTQAAGSCSFTLSPTRAAAPGAGSTGDTVSIATGSSCAGRRSRSSPSATPTSSR